MKTPVLTLDNKKAGDIDLAEEVFGVDVRRDILHRVVRWQLAKRRGGNHKTKQRGEIRGTTAKVWRQKGTGRARHGSRKAPIFVGGGVTFGPQVRDHGYSLPKKVRKLGLKCALSAKQASGELVILDQAALDDHKTKTLKSKLSDLDALNVLIIDADDFDDNLRRAASNLPGVDLIPSQGANVYDILRCQKLALTKAAVEKLEARLK